MSVARGESASDFPAHPLEEPCPKASPCWLNTGLPVSLGRRPVILDPFMLARLEAERPEVVEALARRIERREFDVVVLIYNLTSRWWYTDIHLGPTVSTAICRAYQRVGMVAGQVLYTPRPRNPPSVTQPTCNRR